MKKVTQTKMTKCHLFTALLLMLRVVSLRVSILSDMLRKVWRISLKYVALKKVHKDVKLVAIKMRPFSGITRCTCKCFI